MTDAVAQPNEEAANHHTAIAPKGVDTGMVKVSTTLDAAAGQAGGGADPGHPHLFHLAGAAGSAYEGGSPERIVIARKPGFGGNSGVMA